MVDYPREGISLLLRLIRGVVKSESTTEAPEEEEVEDSTLPDDTDSDPMKTVAYWESDQKKFGGSPYLNPYDVGVGIDSIPDATENPIPETHYKDILGLRLGYPNIVGGVPETPKTTTGISNNGRDAGVVAGIVVAVISGVIILAALIAVVMYRHYVHRNVTSMNFDNPVYRKTTENQFALEQNGYAPGSKLYPSTVGEEVRALTAMECTLNIQNSLR